MLKTASCTREHDTDLHGAGVRPESAHSETPYGEFMAVLLAASRKCSLMMLIVHSRVATRLRSVSFALA